MSHLLMIFLIAVGAVAFFVVGLSLTIMIKGHYMKSEIGDNENMRKRGIKCASQQIRDEERALRGDIDGMCGKKEPDINCSEGGCATCGLNPDAKK